MNKTLCFVATLILLAVCVHPSRAGDDPSDSPKLNPSDAADAGWTEKANLTAGTWNGFKITTWKLGGYDAIVAEPAVAAPGRPWTLAVGGLGYHPEVEKALLNAGFHVVATQAYDLLGSDEVLNLMAQLRAQARQKWKLAYKCAVQGRSRAGLSSYRYAGRHPEQISCIFGDAPVMDIKSWPRKWPANAENWNRAKQLYGFKTEAEAMAYDGNPVDVSVLTPIAKAKIPIYHVIALNDQVVPPEENTLEAQRRLKKLGHDMELSIVKHSDQGEGHLFDLPDLAGITRFFVAHAGKDAAEEAKKHP